MVSDRFSSQYSTGAMHPVNGIMSEVAPDFNFNNCTIDEEHMQVIPVRNLVMFPFLTVPMAVPDEETLISLDRALKNQEAVIAITVKDSESEVIAPKDLYRVGVICIVAKLMEMPDGSHTAFMVAANRAKVKKFIHSKDNGIFAHVEYVPETLPGHDDMEIGAILSSIGETYAEILDLFSPDDTKEVRYALDQFSSPLKRMNFIICNSPLEIDEKQKLLEISDLKKRGLKLLNQLDTAFQMLQIKADIQEKTHAELTSQQRDQFLQQQMRAIKEELGDTAEDNDERDLLARAEKMDWNEDVAKYFRKELEKLGRFAATTPEYGIQFTYLNTLLSLPWNKKATTPFEMHNVEQILDRDHYGLEKIKDRIIEQVAVMKLRGDMKSPILCLYGPPGVGKTSLGKSVAEALGREYIRIALGGVHDESEIRGHRRTYIGAMPGRIIAALKDKQTSNPVIVLDEVDKINKSHNGDPSAALLEVLDPEQNSKFHDNYLDIDYDLSNVLFLATANTLDGISAPLLDRMELIEVSGYLVEEKMEIAARHLLPKALDDLGFGDEKITLTPEGIRFIIEHYTRESGVRQLDKVIRRLLRKIARKKASGLEYDATIDTAQVKALLGKEDYNGELYEGNDYIGVVTGLAWTAAGGEILFIETSLSKGKGEKLTLTGNLGDVMKESATIALQYIRAHAEAIGIDEKLFVENNVHLHVPEGAIPKDGPSAGITMVTSMASAFTGRKVRERIAMTGEMTLRGKVLPVGGIKEKILAAKRSGIDTIILSADNRKDIEDIEPRYIESMTFIYVRDIAEVLENALI